MSRSTELFSLECDVSIKRNWRGRNILFWGSEANH